MFTENNHYVSPEATGSPEHAAMSTLFFQLQEFATREKLSQTLRALDFARSAHEGQYRKGSLTSPEKIPYVTHPLTMMRHAVSLGARDDQLLAAIMLHDVIEDTPYTLDQLPVDDAVRHTVDLVSFQKLPDKTKYESQRLYYRRIPTDCNACIVKILDRCHNVSTMATSFTPEKIASYITETREFVLPLYPVIYERYSQYTDLAYTVEYQTRAIIDSVDFLLASHV